MIIPQIAENLTGSGNVAIPKCCPACGGKTEIRQMNDVETLYCTNSKCSARRIKSFSLFVSRDAMNIEGLSEATLEKFIAHGNNLYKNWLNYYVYQVTPYDLDGTPDFSHK